MGWQSFYVYYKNNYELQKIILAMNEYQKILNTPFSPELEEVGEGLRDICFGIKKRNGKKWIMFGIQGGRDQCYLFFSRRKIKLERFNCDSEKIIGKQDSWYFIEDKHFIKEEFEIIEIKNSIMEELRVIYP